MTTFRISELRIGRARPFGPKGVPSAIDKQPVAVPLHAGPLGLSGDEQGDPRHHGGPDKAVHAYASANYAIWQQDLPDRAAFFRAGGFGENLVVEGIDESGICLGDLWQVGGAVMAVSQGRQPCWKLNLRFDQPDMARRVQDSGRTGWYFRVVSAGPVAAGDQGHLLERPHPDWTLTRVSHLLYHDRMNLADLAGLAALPDLPANWRRLAEARLANRKTEDWSRRIDTPD